MQIELQSPDTFRLHLPNGHAVVLPFTETGMRILRRVLRDSATTPAAKIATTASPIQHMVDLWLKEDAERKRAARAKALGIDLSKLEINI